MHLNYKIQNTFKCLKYVFEIGRMRISNTLQHC